MNEQQEYIKFFPETDPNEKLIAILILDDLLITEKQADCLVNIFDSYNSWVYV